MIQRMVDELQNILWKLDKKKKKKTLKEKLKNKHYLYKWKLLK